MQRGIPDVSSEAADQGTAAHELAEICLKKGTKDVSEHLGITIRVEESGREFTVDEEMVEAVQLYVDTIKADYNSMLPGVQTNVERMFQLESLNKELFGTNDAALGQTFGLLRVYDFKYGKGVVVEVDDNEQMMIYALGALESYTLCEAVELIIIQPRAFHADGPIRRWRISVADLKKWAKDVLKPGAALALMETAPLSADPSWCKWCKAMAICPEIKAQACAVAKVAFEEPVFPPPATLSGAEVAQALRFTQGFSAWAAEVASYARAQMDRGVIVEGYKLVRGKRQRSWADESGAIKALGKEYGEDLYTEPKFKTLAQVEKVIMKAKGIKKPDAEKIISPFMRVDQNLTMAPESDKRPAEVPAIQAFDDGLTE